MKRKVILTPRTIRFIDSYRRTVRERISKAAIKMGLTSHSNLSRVLSGGLNASISMIEAYCRAYNVSKSYIILGADEAAINQSKINDLEDQIKKLKILLEEKERTIAKLME